MKAGFLGIAALKVRQATGFQKILSGSVFRSSSDKNLYDYQVRRRPAELSLGPPELRDWVLWRTDGLRLLQFGIRVVLGTLFLLPIVTALLLFCAVAICTDKLGGKG